MLAGSITPLGALCVIKRLASNSCAGWNGSRRNGQRKPLSADRDRLPNQPPKSLDASKQPSGCAGPLQKFLELLEEVGPWSLGLTFQHHPGLVRGTPALGLIACQAAAHQVLPGGGAA